MTTIDIKSLSLEEAFATLDETLQQLESGKLPLAKAIELYEQGMLLAKQCSHQLDEAELRIKKLAP